MRRASTIPAFYDLRSFIAFLEARGELIRVRQPVSAELEITEIADRMVKSGGPALLFENVEGKAFPLAINLVGSRQRMAWALGQGSLDGLSDDLRSLLDLNLSGGLRGLLSNLPKLRLLPALRPKRVRRAPVQEVVWRGDEVDLTRLPVLTCWPQDGGPFITLPLVITRDPETGEGNVGMYRMQLYGRRETGMHWQRHKTGARHLESAERLGRRLEVAVALGGDPALTYAATAPLPAIPGVDEYTLTGYLRRRRVELVKGVSVDLEVPAHAEFVLEGYVDPGEPWRSEGPFGDHTGFYTLEDPYPVFHVTAVTMRRDAIYPATIVGRPPMEDAFLIEASERLFLVPAQTILPEIRDYHLPPAGIAHNLVNVLIDKRYPGQAYKVANGLLGLGQMMLAKVILVSDSAVSPRDHLGFWRTVLANALPGRDQQFAKGPIDVLDHASRAWSYGSKLVIDGTSKHPEEGDGGSWQANGERAATDLPTHPEVHDQHQIAGGFWFLTTDKTRPGQGRHLGEWAARQQAARGVRLIGVVDHDTAPHDFEACLWTLLNNIDPERDVHIVPGEAGIGPAFVFDGTRKLPSEGFDRPWPEKIVMSDAVVRRVNERWLALVGATGARRRHGETGPGGEEAAGSGTGEGET